MTLHGCAMSSTAAPIHKQRSTHRAACKVGAQLGEDAAAAAAACRLLHLRRRAAVCWLPCLGVLLHQLRDQRVLVRDLLVALGDLRPHPGQCFLLRLQDR